MFKQEKGITLIALVITIIVLLILAGITIAMLTGNDSTPKKANEAAAKDQIAAVKDQINLKAMDALTTFYETTYVNNTTSGTVATTAAQDAVAGAIAKDYKKDTVVSGVTISETPDVTSSTHTYAIKLTSTKDTSVFVNGSVNANGGIDWKAFNVD